MNKIIKIYSFIFLGFFLLVILTYLWGMTTGQEPISFGRFLSISLLFPLFCSAIIGSAMNILDTVRNKGLKIYKWQNVFIWIIAVLTPIATISNFSAKGTTFSRSYIGAFLDMLFGVFLNTLALAIIFIIFNWIYRKMKSSNEMKPIEQESKPVHYCSNCGFKINDNPNFCPSCGNKF